MMMLMKIKPILLLVSALAGAGIVVWLVAFAANSFLAAESKPKQPETVSCTTHGDDHHVVIKDDKPSQTVIIGRLCDTLTITNDDAVIREMAFGPHEDHQVYDGVTVKLLEKNQSFTVVMDKTGTYHFHDHIHDEVAGDFTVLN